VFSLLKGTPAFKNVVMPLISSPHAVQSRLLLETVIHSFVRVLPHTLGLGWWDRFWGCKSGVPTLASLSSNRRVCSHFMPPSEHRGLWILESTYISNSNGPVHSGNYTVLRTQQSNYSQETCQLFWRYIFFILWAPYYPFFPRIISASLVPVLKHELTVSVQ